MPDAAEICFPLSLLDTRNGAPIIAGQWCESRGLLVSTDTVGEQGNTSLLTGGDESPGFLLGLRSHHSSGSVGAPHFILMRVEV